eukprot:1501388-Pyramimonas_sp.AAC.1
MKWRSVKPCVLPYCWLGAVSGAPCPISDSRVHVRFARGDRRGTANPFERQARVVVPPSHLKCAGRR